MHRLNGQIEIFLGLVWLIAMIYTIREVRLLRKQDDRYLASYKLREFRDLTIIIGMVVVLIELFPQAGRAVAAFLSLLFSQPV
jgi:hypothetical protein